MIFYWIWARDITTKGYESPVKVRFPSDWSPGARAKNRSHWRRMEYLQPFSEGETFGSCHGISVVW